jgi:hypothetical protein
VSSAMTAPECRSCQEHGAPAKERETMWAADGVGLSKSVEVHIMTPGALDAGPGVVGVNVCPAEFWSCFDPILPCSFPIPAFWNGNVYFVP